MNTLTDEQAEQFHHDGYVVVPEAFPRAAAAEAAQLVWDALDEDPDDRATWTREGTVVQQMLSGPAAEQVMSPRYQDAIADLLGAGRYVAEGHERLGYAVVRFPVETPTWQAQGWHVDGSFFHHFVHSPEQGLVGVDLLTDIDPEGGGTAIRPGSHRVVAGILAAAPDGLSSGDLGRRAIEATRDLDVVEACGRAGDALLMHPHLLHGSSSNRSPRARIITNRCISLREPMNFDRDGEHSRVEAAVRDAVRAAQH